MDWITDLRTAIKFMEDNMFENISAQDVSNHVYMSNYNFQKAFHIVTGYSVSEYIRNRRLFLAANEIISTNAKIIDIALKYCYNTSESFTKAFILTSAATSSYLSAKISPCCVANPRWATALLAVCSLSDKILS